MAFPQPQFNRLAARLPPHPAWLLPVLAGLGLAGAVGSVAFRHPWIGAGLLLVGVLAAGLGQAGIVLVFGLLALPFGFALDDPARALAAMFLTFALAVVTVLRKGDVSPAHWLAAAAFMFSCQFPDRFSLLAYIVGIVCFIVAGQGLAKARRSHA